MDDLQREILEFSHKQVFSLLFVLRSKHCWMWLEKLQMAFKFYCRNSSTICKCKQTWTPKLWIVRTACILKLSCWKSWPVLQMIFFLFWSQFIINNFPFFLVIKIQNNDFINQLFFALTMMNISDHFLPAHERTSIENQIKLFSSRIFYEWKWFFFFNELNDCWT